MANTTSGTYTFDKTLSIDEIIEEVLFERLGLSGSNSGFDLKGARRSLEYSVFKNGETEVSIIGK
jgi:hypothetical protein